MKVTIKLKIKDVEIELDLKEAKELKEILEGITEKKIITEKEYVPYYPYRYRYPDYPWTVTWGADDTSTDIGKYTISYKQ